MAENNENIVIPPNVLAEAVKKALAEADNRPLNEYSTPSATNIKLSMTDQNAGDRDFTLSPSLISLVQQHTFSGLPFEDANNHLQRFLRCCATVSYRGVDDDIIKLKLFPFSILNRAEAWFQGFRDKPFENWDDLAKSFLERFYPREKTAHMRNQICNFKQEDDESLSEAWERFKELQRMCPHHDISPWMLLQIFYDHSLQTTKQILDATAGGALMSKPPKEAYDLIDKIALTQTNWSIRSKGQAKVNEVKATEAKVEEKVDDMTIVNQKFDNMQLQINKLVTKTLESQKQQVMKCQLCDEEGHAANMCQHLMGLKDKEQVCGLSDIPPRHPKNYGLPWTYKDKRDHPGFHWRDDTVPNPNANTNTNPNVNPPRTNFYRSNQPPYNPSKTIADMEHFIYEQGRMNELVHNDMMELKENMRMLLEYHKMGTTATRAPGTFPGQPEPNPKGET